MALKVSKTLWILLTTLVVGFTAYVVGRNLVHIWKTSRRLATLEEQSEAYQKQIEADSTLLEQLRYDDYLERYARERFQMKRHNEKVYILQ